MKARPPKPSKAGAKSPVDRFAAAREAAKRVALNALKRAKRQEEEALMDLYLSAIGGL